MGEEAWKKALNLGQKANMDDGGKGMTDKQGRNALNEAIQMLEDLSDVAELRGNAYIYKTKTPEIREMVKGLKELTCSVDLEEIESLRSQLQRAEQERDKYQKAYHEHAAEVVRLSEANTAMREALEWYGNGLNYYMPTDLLNDGGAKARAVLSRYPKEGDTICETDTTKK